MYTPSRRPAHPESLPTHDCCIEGNFTGKDGRPRLPRNIFQPVLVAAPNDRKELLDDILDDLHGWHLTFDSMSAAGFARGVLRETILFMAELGERDAE